MFIFDLNHENLFVFDKVIIIKLKKKNILSNEKFFEILFWKNMQKERNWLGKQALRKKNKLVIIQTFKDSESESLIKGY